jgi:hypothetical protein
MMASMPADIPEWSQQRPVWQRDALHRLFASGDLTPNDLGQLAEICKAQHGPTTSKPFAPLAAWHLPISEPAAGSPVSLVSLWSA